MQLFEAVGHHNVAKEIRTGLPSHVDEILAKRHHVLAAHTKHVDGLGRANPNAHKAP
jgi:hypothetical protein